MNNKPEERDQTIHIRHEYPIDINLGDIFYMIEAASSKNFYEPCHVCDGTGSLTVKGVTFRCPCCEKQSVRFNVHEYVVRKYRVSKLTVRINDEYWKFDPDDIKLAEFEMYNKHGHGYGCCVRRSIPTHGVRRYGINPDESCLERRDVIYRNGVATEETTKVEPYYVIDDLLYTDYKQACAMAAKFNDMERARVEAYNAEHGTNFEFPEFKYKNDSKN